MLSSPLKEIEEMINTIQPLYTNMNANFSKSYLSGSIWYVGDDLMDWWKKCNNVRYYSHNVRKLMLIVGFVKIHYENILKNF